MAHVSRGHCVYCYQPIPFKVVSNDYTLIINPNYRFSLAGLCHRVCSVPVIDRDSTTEEEENKPLRGRKKRVRREHDIQVEWFDGHEIYMYRDRLQLYRAMISRGLSYPRSVGARRYVRIKK